MEKVLFKCLNAFSRRHVHVKKEENEIEIRDNEIEFLRN